MLICVEVTLLGDFEALHAELPHSAHFSEHLDRAGSRVIVHPGHLAILAPRRAHGEHSHHLRMIHPPAHLRSLEEHVHTSF
jgi:hypothetical protein